MMWRRSVERLCVWGLFSCLLNSCGSLFAQTRTTALSPTESLQQMQLEEGYEVRLLASEPLVVDPIEVAFDDAGRLWVVEMRDYPFCNSDQPQGKIRVLTDRDGDGQYDQAHLFADHLDMPTGLAFWRDGVVVTLAGQLVFMRDANGDLAVDEKQVWLEGFAKDNEQLRANHPRFGPDGTWTIASGLRGGNVQLGDYWRAADALPQALTIGSRDVRFDPQSAEIELITGPAQFGLCFDALGNRFFCSNRNPAVKVIFEQEDLVGNPLAGILPSVIDVVPAGEASRVFPLVDAWTTSNLHSGQFTAACGVFVRVVDLANASKPAPTSPSVISEIFSCEPTGSLVKRSVIQNTTAYESSLIIDTTNPPREWLASRDAWFRPVNVTHAPDGGLVVVDMHRAVIEHPAWVPEELKQRPDERWGDDAGRLYWIGQSVLANQPTLASALHSLSNHPLRSLSNERLVEQLVAGSRWHQESASRILIERSAVEVVPQLFRLASDSTVPLLARVTALKLVGVLAEQLPVDFLQFLDSNLPIEVRVAALQVFRDFPNHAIAPTEAIVRLAEENTIEEPRAAELGFETWLTLGQIIARDPAAFQVSTVLLDRAAELGTRDPYQLVAAASAVRAQPGRLLGHWISQLSERSQPFSTDNRGKWSSDEQIATLARGLAAAELKQASPDDSLFEPLIATALQHNYPAARLAAVAALAEVTGHSSSWAQRSLSDEFWQTLQNLVNDGGLGNELERNLVELLSRSPREIDRQRLGVLAREIDEPQRKALFVTAWATLGGDECDRYLIELLSSTNSPSLQHQVASLIGQQPTRLQRLAEELSAGGLSPRQLGATELKNLASRANGEVQRQLQDAFDQLVNADRQQVVEQYQVCLELLGDPLRGRQVFQIQCATCHRIADVGVQVGPDISDSRTQQPIQLLTSILNPNLAIDNNYFRYVILTVNDQIIEGMVAEETADAIVIRGPENKRSVIARNEIAQLKATGVSLMPEGLEAQIDRQAMADLIAFIKGWRYLDGAIPGK